MSKVRELLFTVWEWVLGLFCSEKRAGRDIEWYGWRPDTPDYRDHHYEIPEAHKAGTPAKVDLRPGCPPVYDQGSLGSCTANAIGALYEFVLKKQLKPDFMPSRLFIYYNEREVEGTISEDAGAEIRDGIKVIAKLGVCPEKTWPYIISKFTKKPSATAYKEALNHQALKYERLDNTKVEMLKACLASGYPIVFGFTVYDAFEGDTVTRTGVLNLPRPEEKSLGGHAVMLVGYDDSRRRFLVRNSWGSDWGQGGYFSMPYEYVTNPHLADDFWTIRLVEG
jgi:C1A family cysteine protease